MKINKSYLYKVLKNSVPDLDYKIGDMVYRSSKGSVRLSTSKGFYPEYYVHAFFNSDIVEIRVHRNLFDDEGEYLKDVVIDRYGSSNSQIYRYGCKELI